MVKPLALTLGEPAGIGPDIAIAAWLRRDELKLPAFYLTGDRDFLGRRAALLGFGVELKDVRAEDAVAAFEVALPVVSTGHAATARPGQPDDSSADAAIEKMTAAFDSAIEKSAKVTEITTEKKTELDATKQRPQN